jgi:DNA-binding HxlR family transcriptional regulator
MRQAIARKKKGAEAANAVLSVLSQKWKLTIVLKIILE